MGFEEYFDFREYIEDEFEVRTGYSRDEISIDCINPDCDDNWRRRKHMSVNVSKKIAFCFKCNTSYNLFSFIMTHERISYGEAFKRIHDAVPKRTYGPNRLDKAMEALRSRKKEAEPTPVKTPLDLPIMIPIVKDHPAQKYLAGRNFDQKVIHQFGLSFCPAGPFAGRIIIPVYTEGKIVSYQGRSIYGAEPKYLFPRGADLASHLYNYDDARYFGSIILVEGVTDCWRVWNKGYHNVAATFGKALKADQLNALKANDRIKEVVFFWDGNAIKEAYGAALELISYKKVRIVELPYELEPDTCPHIGDALEGAVKCEEMARLDMKLKTTGLI